MQSYSILNVSKVLVIQLVGPFPFSSIIIHRQDMQWQEVSSKVEALCYVQVQACWGTYDEINSITTEQPNIM